MATKPRPARKARFHKVERTVTFQVWFPEPLTKAEALDLIREEQITEHDGAMTGWQINKTYGRASYRLV
jgi:hypothetical protein